jgi:hypothetical protein
MSTDRDYFQRQADHIARLRSQLANLRARYDHGAVSIDDFFAYMPMHTYIFTPSRELWPASSVNARIPPVAVPDMKKPSWPAHGWIRTAPSNK